MKVDNSSDYKLIFSISNHPWLGLLIEPYVIELTPYRTLSLTYQKLFSGNAGYYTKLTQEELDLISILDPIKVEQIIKHFSPQKKIRPREYFNKYFNRDQFRAEIRPFIEVHLAHLLSSLLPDFDGLFIADDINPAAQPVQITDGFTSVLFHFRRNEYGTKYFATIKYNGERIPFMKSGALLLTNQPAFLIAQNMLLRFYDFVEGNKLNVFINRKFILVKPEQEREYFSTFVIRLLERSPVFAQGFEIRQETHPATAVILIREMDNGRMQMGLHFKYGPFFFDYHPTKYFHVNLSWKGDEPLFTKVKRSYNWEDQKASVLRSLGAEYLKDNIFSLEQVERYDTIRWLTYRKEELEKAGFEIHMDGPQKYALQKPVMKYSVNEKTDWFDVEINITIGDEIYPFTAFLKHIRNADRLFRLNNGLIFIIPEEWFALGEKLMHHKKEGTFRLNKFRLDVLDIIPSGAIKRHLRNFIDIQEEQPHSKFKGKLRPYQIDGLSWMMFLYNNRFGGILADDMGLGKTVQTLAFLQKVIALEKENRAGENEAGIPPSLLIVPTSLLYNWLSEASKFTPDLKLLLHAGTQRTKNSDDFLQHHLIVTTYGLARNDFELFKDLEFLYVILDESQNIKNRSTKSTQTINKINATHRLCLTGTPIENSIKDLWSQMNFLNKGLLGSAKYFDEQYVKPIEKKKDEIRTNELRKLVRPFVLRRTKQQVAKDLPDMTEKTILCPMTPAQEEMYEEVKSKYRNELLNLVEEKGLEKSRLSILQGLTKLRLLANHPLLVDKQYTKDSGKHNLLLEYTRTAIEEGHKVLIFSQFVRYLSILEKDIKEMNIPFLKLTGHTSAPKRKEMVAKFQDTSEFPVFLISLKAGGTGLNLTAADFVFIADPWWNPAVEAQARDRTHRIGQLNKVFSYKFISAASIEEKILTLQSKKKKVAGEIIQIEENVIKSLNSDDIKELFT